MLLRFAVACAVLVLPLGAVGKAQTPPATSVPAAPAPAKTAPKKPGAKAKAGPKQPAAVEAGPCRLGVISALGDRFSVHKFGVTIFETENSEIPVEGWGLDDLAMTRVRAATGNDPSVRRISYPKGAFELYYRPKSILLREPNEDLQQIVRSITQNANCERYLVMLKYSAKLSGTNHVLDGIGTYNQGLGTIFRHSHLFANVGVTMIDGNSYERINPSLAAIGAGFTSAFSDDSITRLENSDFPDPPQSASSSAILKERTRALVSAKLDRAIRNRLQD